MVLANNFTVSSGSVENNKTRTFENFVSPKILIKTERLRAMRRGATSASDRRSAETFYNFCLPGILRQNKPYVQRGSVETTAEITVSLVDD